KELLAQSTKDPALVFGIKSSTKTAFRSACKLAGVEDFVFHDCRHTATTRMIASGSPHAEVMKITGHTRLKTFLRYLNISSKTSSKVAGRLDSYLERESPKQDVSSSVH
ncbi:MAG: tyrosine-type recombinase/integrase, partial [Pyrinomonadaceae bacterium]|nr:tyrosine-type recombinase/integrase [Pyrinomonadaceae bacterium]